MLPPIFVKILQEKKEKRKEKALQLFINRDINYKQYKEILNFLRNIEKQEN